VSSNASVIEDATSTDQDPFYEPPPGFAEVEPGTVLRSRDVTIGFLGMIAQRVAATQLLYRTTNLHGDAEVAVTTVLLPAQPDPARPCPLLSYQCAIDAVSSRCFPSHAMRLGAGPVGAFTQAEYLLVAAALAEGWAVSVPDHEGCHGMWGSPREPGYRILDGVRAALAVARKQAWAASDRRPESSGGPPIQPCNRVTAAANPEKIKDVPISTRPEFD